MLIPAPLPIYTLAPDLEGIDEKERALLDRCLVSLTGRAEALVVTRIGQTLDHSVVEVETATGPVLLLDLRTPTGDLSITLLGDRSPPSDGGSLCQDC